MWCKDEGGNGRLGSVRKGKVCWECEAYCEVVNEDDALQKGKKLKERGNARTNVMMEKGMWE